MENNYYGVIYRITNIVNGRFYIGQTTMRPSKRWAEHKCSKKSQIGRAIKKHGKHNFLFQIICVCYDQTELDNKEEFFIEKYKSFVTQNGYNMVNYYKGVKKVSEIVRNKIKMSWLNDPVKLEKSRQTALKSRGKKIGDNPASCFVGVKLNKKTGVWQSQICFNSKKIGLGYYNEEQDAAKAYDMAAIKFFGENSLLNFPELRTQYINNEITIQKRLRTKSSNAIVGVSYLKACNRWRARLNGKSKYCKTKTEAEYYIRLFKIENS